MKDGKVVQENGWTTLKEVAEKESADSEK